MAGELCHLATVVGHIGMKSRRIWRPPATSDLKYKPAFPFSAVCNTELPEAITGSESMRSAAITTME